LLGPGKTAERLTYDYWREQIIRGHLPGGTASVCETPALMPPRRPSSGALSRGLVAAFIEAHIEQGPVFEETNHTVGVVIGIRAYATSR